MGLIQKRLTLILNSACNKPLKRWFIECEKGTFLSLICFLQLGKWSDINEEYLEAESGAIPVTLCLVVMVAYMCGGAAVFAYTHNWPFLHAIFFCFSSLTTIGFGDLSPGIGTRSEVSLQVSLLGAAIYLLVGMALIATCFNLMQEQVTTRGGGLSRKLSGMIGSSARQHRFHLEDTWHLESMALFSYGPGCGIKHSLSGAKSPVGANLSIPTINSVSSPTGSYETTVLTETHAAFQGGLSNSTANKMPLNNTQQTVSLPPNSPLLGDWDKPETMYSSLRRDNHTLKPVPPPTVPAATPAKTKKTVTICDEIDRRSTPPISE